MKLILTLALTLLSLSAFAFNEVECEGNTGINNIYLEIEQPFPNSSVFKRMLLSVATQNDQDNFQYTVTSNSYSGLNRILYQGSALRLEVDLWPDNAPRWGRTYRAVLNTSVLNEGAAAVLNCRFPNAI